MNHWIILCFGMVFGFLNTHLIKAQSLDLDHYYHIWEEVKIPEIKDKFIKHHQVVSLLDQFQRDNRIELSQIGTSFEGRSIHLVKLGTGKRNVLLWTQMHGDEPTATMAILDLINFFHQQNELEDWKEKVLNEISIYIIPMLNPDGAEVYKRRNALDIDLNRDALRLQSPESILLKSIRDSLTPEFGFNLHDQSIYYTAGHSDKPATISFLAPAYNEDKELNDTRANAMRLITILNRSVQHYLPGHVGRFNDTFEPRAFGDNIQKWGTSTILIESGGYPGDVHKQMQRRLNFSMFLIAMETIADKSFLYEGLKEYHEIPFNVLRSNDLLVRNLIYPFKDSMPILDVAFKRTELLNAQKNDFIFGAYVADLGDMSGAAAFEIIDADSAVFVKGKLYKGDLRQIQQIDVWSLIEQGYTHVLVKDLPSGHKVKSKPLQFLLHERSFKNNLEMNQNPGFILQKNGQNLWFVNNGFAYSWAQAKEIFKGMKIKDLYE